MKNNDTSLYSIHQLPEMERPREKLAKYGSESLSTVELIAIILGSGTKSNPVLQLAQQLVLQFGGLKKLSEATIEELCQIKGLGTAKAIQLKAVFGIGIKISQQMIPAKYRIENPVHVFHLLKDEVGDNKKEIFFAILLDSQGFVINHQIISVGTLTEAIVHPREVFYPAIRHKAVSIVLAHNHPSGDCKPSEDDIDTTKSLIAAGKLIGIPLKDHVILSESNYCSLRQRGIAFDLN